MVLVDTSVWIDHFRGGVPKLRVLLEEGLVLQHEFILGELACGNFRNRRELLSLLGELPRTETVAASEVMHFIERQKLFGKGLGWVDVSLLASVKLDGLRLWSHDKALHEAAVALDLELHE